MYNNIGSHFRKNSITAAIGTKTYFYSHVLATTFRKRGSRSNAGGFR